MAKRWIGWHRRRVSVNRVWPSEWKRPVFTHSVCVSRTPRLANRFKSNELGITSNGMSDALLYASLQRIWYKSGCGSLLNPTLYLRFFIGCFGGFHNLEHPLFLLTPSDRTFYPFKGVRIVTTTFFRVTFSDDFGCSNWKCENSLSFCLLRVE